MEFTFDSTYDKKMLITAARVVRKTTQKTKCMIMNIVYWILITLYAILAALHFVQRINIAIGVLWIIICLCLLSVLIFQDRFAAFRMGKTILPHQSRQRVTFTDSGCTAETEISSLQYTYDMIVRIAETEEYFVLMLSKVHVMPLLKSSISGGSVEDFRGFITRSTGKQIEKFR